MSLTEDWKAGRLLRMDYWVKLINDDIIISFFNGLEFSCCKDFGIREILAPCDYEELLRLKEYETLYHHVVGEIYNLRSLLKECKEFLYMYPTSEIDPRDLYRKVIDVLG